MAGYAVLHVMTKGAGSPALAEHTRGERRPAEACGRTEWDGAAAIRIAGDPDAAAEVIEAARAARRRGRKGLERVRLLLAGPPPFESDGAWPKDRVLTWATRSADWVARSVARASGGAAVVEDCTLHVDERSPHLHVSVVPAVPGKAVGDPPRLSWKELQRRWGQAADPRKSLGAIQTSYAADVGAEFGLKRGRPKSETAAKHEAPDHARGLVERLADSERQLAAMRERLAAAELDVRRARAEAARNGKALQRLRRKPARERGPGPSLAAAAAMANELTAAEDAAWAARRRAVKRNERAALDGKPLVEVPPPPQDPGWVPDILVPGRLAAERKRARLRRLGGEVVGAGTAAASLVRRARADSPAVPEAPAAPVRGAAPRPAAQTR